MQKFMALAVVVMMVFAFGIAGVSAQQADTKSQGTMMCCKGCPMMAKADDAKCAMGEDGKCPMAADKCPMPSHHGLKKDPVPDHGAH